MFRVVMEWKYGDVLVIIQNQNTVVVTAVDWGNQNILENVANNCVQVSVRDDYLK